ncbi:alpha/beta hydrolase [Rubripirellula amarantea]|nr:alpha/beta hydrolase [Rubripirellula amarantea]
MIFRFATFAVLASLALYVNAENPAAAPVKLSASAAVELVEGVVYSTAGDVELKLDLAKPSDTDKPLPCVVVIHGGAWRQGDRRSHLNDIRGLAEHGYVAATISYRFCPEHRFPAQVDDVRNAVRFLREHANDYGIDASRLGAMGFSAGAHLAMLLGVMEDEHQPTSKVQAVVSYFGPTDFTQPNIPDISVPLLADFIGGSLAEKPESYRQASPITFVDSTDAPILLFQGTNDPLIPVNQAVLMAERMSKHNVDGRVELLIGEGHGWGGVEKDHTNEQTLQFFNRHLMHR